MELTEPEEEILTANIFENPDFEKPGLFFGAAILYTNYEFGYRVSGIVLSVKLMRVRMAFPSSNSIDEVCTLTVDRTKRDFRDRRELDIKRIYNRQVWEKYLEPKPLIEELYNDTQN